MQTLANVGVGVGGVVLGPAIGAGGLVYTLVKTIWDVAHLAFARLEANEGLRKCRIEYYHSRLGTDWLYTKTFSAMLIPIVGFVWALYSYHLGFTYGAMQIDLAK